MPQRRPILVWLLLVAFVVGGAAGPALHRVQHGAKQISDRPEIPCHAAGVHHAEVSFWTEVASDLRAPACDLCATRLLVVPPTLAPSTAPRVVGTTAVEMPSPVAAADVATHRFIRGPPSLSEARPA